ncbi:MAG: universal stress protein [Pseudomonadota bacterium]
MTGQTGKPRKILAVVDTRKTQIALESAFALAQTHDASLEVIACVEPPSDLSLLSRLSGADSDRLIAAAVARSREEIEARLAELIPDRSVPLSVSVGKVYLEVIRHVANSGCDVVVKQAEPLVGVDRFLFASTDQHLLRKCPCSVWLQTDSAPKRPRRILAAVDLDLWDAEEPKTLEDLNRRVIDAACILAGAPDTEITVLHAWDAPAEGMVWAFSDGSGSRLNADRYVNEILETRHEAMRRFIAQVRSEDGFRPSLVPRLARGSPETVIYKQSREMRADVVVMGTVARTGLSGVFIGNTAENIINGLDCPVLAVKPEGFQSPLQNL